MNQALLFGCGRYIQAHGALDTAGEECRRFGSRTVIFSDGLCKDLVMPKLGPSLSEAGVQYEVYTPKRAAVDDIAEASAFVRSAEAEFVIGVGGGAMIDFSKSVCIELGLQRFVSIPTSSATCAPFAPIALCYSTEGKLARNVKLPDGVSLLLADLDILCAQPVRMLAAGILDAMSKKVEIQMVGARLRNTSADYGCAVALSNAIYDRLDAIFETACADCAAKRCSPELEDAIFLSLAGAGVASGMTSLPHTGIAHKVYHFGRNEAPAESAHLLHGELVAIGIVAQIAYNEGAEAANRFAARLRSVGLPATVAEAGLPNGDGMRERCAKLIDVAACMKGGTDAEHAAVREALKTVF